MAGSPTVAIVGAGCAGTLTALALLNASPFGRHAANIVMVERTPDVHRGVAYRTTCDRHVLNVRASDMSALAQDPDHFVRWLARRAPGFGRDSFAPRHLYGSYLTETIADAGQGRSLELIRGEVIDIDGTLDAAPAEMKLLDGRRVAADVVILAVGNFAPRQPRVVDSSVRATGCYLGDPWRPGILAAIEPHATVLLLGSGLTAVDVALSLSSQGHRGPIRAVSRHGLLPETHRCRPSRLMTADCVTALPALSARALVHAIRQQATDAVAGGGDWRSVIDGLREDSNLLWSRLPAPEQRRVLRLLRSYWGVHRHRMAPEVAASVEALRATGQFLVTPGSLEQCDRCPDRETCESPQRCLESTGPRLRVEIESRTGRVAFEVDYLVNCTGPEGDVAAMGDPLLDSLLARGRAAPGSLGLGLAVSPDGAVIDRTGHTSAALWAIGSLRHGTFWETNAVPDIRRQAAALAENLGSVTELRPATSPGLGACEGPPTYEDPRYRKAV